VGDLDQNARPVAGLRIAPARATMRQVDQDLDALQYDVVRTLPAQVHDESHPARVVFVARVI